VDERGIVRAKYFEEDHRERHTASNLLVRLGESTAGRVKAETKHLKLAATASDPVVRAGNRVRLILDIELKPGMHVYSPAVRGSYIPIDWQMPGSNGWLAHPVEYPVGKSLHLPAIRETVPVYEGRFRLSRDLTIGQNQEIRPLLNTEGKLTVDSALRYQACDNKACYPPQTIPLKWTFDVEQHDAQRAPERLRKRGGSGF
jgi:DsbC/DsbD-like thiol-disulfide interchange protein